MLVKHGNKLMSFLTGISPCGMHLQVVEEHSECSLRQRRSWKTSWRTATSQVDPRQTLAQQSDGYGKPLILKGGGNNTPVPPSMRWTCIEGGPSISHLPSADSIWLDADGLQGSRPLAAAQPLRRIWPAAQWLQGTCAWAAESLLAHSPTGPAQSEGHLPSSRWRCSLIATGMALDRLLRVLPSADQHPAAAQGTPCSIHSRPTAAPQPCSSHHLSDPQIRREPAGRHLNIIHAAQETSPGGACSDPTSDGRHAASRQQPGEEGAVEEAWRTAQQALLALLEQEQAEDTAAHAWQVGSLAWPLPASSA